jgi:putative inorganic carbon (hco3(-)) transporter
MTNFFELLETSIFYCLISLIFISLFFPGETYPLTLLICRLLTTTCFVIWFLSFKKNGFTINRNKLLIGLLLILIIAIEISSFTSIGNFRTRQFILNFLPIILIFILISSIKLTKEKFVIFIIFIALSSCYVSTLGVYQKIYSLKETGDFITSFKFAEDRIIDDAKKRIGTGRVFSTFQLPSTYAGYLSIIIPIILLSALTIKNKMFRILCILLLAVSFASLIFSKSFGGILGFFLSNLIFGSIYFTQRYRFSLSKFILLLLTMIFVISMMIALIGSNRPDNPWNFSHPENPMLLRFKNWSSALNIMRDYPITGTGAGTFGAIYTKYAPSGSNPTQHVHNSYLELGAETGVLGFLALTCFSLIWIYKAIRICQKDSENQVLWKNILLSIGGSSFLIHNIVDFDLYSPALSLFAFSVLALPFSSEEPFHSNIMTSKRSTTILYILIPLLISLFVYSFFSIMHYQSSKFFGIEDRILWKKRLADSANILYDLRKAAEIEPDNPIYYVYMAKVYEYLSNLKQNKTAWIDLSQALDCYNKAIALEPTMADAYAQAAKLSLMISKPDKALDFIKVAIRYNPRMSIYRDILDVAKQQSDTLSSKIKNYNYTDNPK